METALYNSFSTNAQTLAGALAIIVAHVELASGDFLWLSSVRSEEEVRYTNVAQVVGDHCLQIDDLLRRLVQRNLDRRRMRGPPSNRDDPGAGDASDCSGLHAFAIRVAPRGVREGATDEPNADPEWVRSPLGTVSADGGVLLRDPRDG
jgi:hypothetical protein